MNTQGKSEVRKSGRWRTRRSKIRRKTVLSWRQNLIIYNLLNYQQGNIIQAKSENLNHMKL